MKHIFLTISLIIISLTLSLAQSNDQRLSELVNKSDYFTLKKEYPKLKNNASEFMQLLSESIINSYFNNPSEANNTIVKLLSDYSQILGFEKSIYISILMADNFNKLGNYENAASIYEQLLSQTSQYLDKKNVNDLSACLKIFNLLKKLPSFYIGDKQTDTIPFQIDQFNFITIPAQINHHNIDLLIDFGAGNNLIAEKYAKDLNVDYIADSTFQLSINKDTIYSKLAVVKELQIGNIKLYNVPFHITPESIMKDLPVEYEIKAIIGVNTLNNFKNLTFNKNNMELVINSDIPSTAESNMILFNDKLVVNTSYNEDNLLMEFDTGSKETLLLNKYYQKYQNQNLDWNKSTTNLAGYMGSKKSDILIQKDFKIKVGTKEFDINNIKIIIGNIFENEHTIDGYLGMDLFNKSNGLIIDLKNMSIKYL